MSTVTPYTLGRALAAEEEFKLDYHGQPEGELAAERIEDIAHEIARAGGWTEEVERGYFDARAEYAQERHA